MKARPPRAIGNFSASLILSISLVKYSSGSLSLVSFFGSSSNPNPIFTLVFGRVVLRLSELAGVDGVKAEAVIITARSIKETKVERIMVGCV